MVAASAPAAAAPVRRPGQTDAAAKRFPILGRIAMIAFVSPVWFMAGDTLLTPTRLLAVIFIPIILIRLLSGAYGRIVLPDIMILSYSAWVMLSYISNQGTRVFVYASLQVAMLLGGYLIGRATVRSPEAMMSMARMFAGMVIFFLPFAIYESISGHYLIPAWIDAIPFLDSVKEIDYDRRMGLDRAQVMMAHPIHFGLYCSMPLSLYVVGLANHVNFYRRVFVAFLILGAVFLSVSSGPFFSALFQMMLIGYFLVTRRMKKPWKLLLWGSAITYTILELASDTFAFYAIASRIAFNPSTAFYRRLIWRFGSEQVHRTPMFGVGQGYWARPFWMSSSIDNFWLQIAVTSGLPATIFMIVAFFGLMIRAGRGQYVPGTDAYNVRIAWTITFVSLSLALSTVTVWNEVLTVTMFMLGAGAYMLQVEPKSQPAAPAAAAAPVRGGVRRRPGGAAKPASPPPADAADAADAPAARRGPSYTRFAHRSRRDRT